MQDIDINWKHIKDDLLTLQDLTLSTTGTPPGKTHICLLVLRPR